MDGNCNRNPSYFLGFGEGSSSSSSALIPLTTNHHENSDVSIIKAKIMSHPHYPRLLSAYINCHKIGASPEVVARLEEACSSSLMMSRASSVNIGADPALDQFMEAYTEMLSKYEEELSKPFKEAMVFLSRVDTQFRALTPSSPSLNPAAGSDFSDEDMNANFNNFDPLAEDRDLRGQLLQKYSGYLGSLKQEFMKKRKKGKLPNDARQQLLDWWNQHDKWPYPSESQKVALAESTGLDQKQINNWFINQRKRHWKPSEDIPFMVVMGDAAAPHPHYFLDNSFANPYPLDSAPALLYSDQN